MKRMASDPAGVTAMRARIAGHPDRQQQGRPCATYPTAKDADGGRVRSTDADHAGRSLTSTVEDGEVTGVAALDSQDRNG